MDPAVNGNLYIVFRQDGTGFCAVSVSQERADVKIQFWDGDNQIGRDQEAKTVCFEASIPFFN